MEEHREYAQREPPVVDEAGLSLDHCGSIETMESTSFSASVAFTRTFFAANGCAISGFDRWYTFLWTVSTSTYFPPRRTQFRVHSSGVCPRTLLLITSS